MNNEQGMDKLRSAKTFYSIMQAVGQMQDYYAVGLAYALIMELHDGYLLKPNEHNIEPDRLYLDELEALRPLVYDCDFSEISLDKTERAIGKMYDGNKDAVSSLLLCSLKYVAGYNMSRNSTDDWFELMDQIKNTYIAIRRKLPEWKDRESLPYIKLNVAKSVGWDCGRYNEFPWRKF